ncbi:MAG: peptidase MA family metallohydrolase [Chloroflexota bacterium]
MRKRFQHVGLWIALVVMAIMAARPVLAQSETQLQSTADYAYGQAMRFHLRASNLGEVARVTLYFRPHTSTDAYSVEIPIQPGEDIDVSYSLDLTQTKLPPFSSVAYWWELERADGATLRVPERTISYVDDQFSWQWLSKADPEGGGVVNIQWTGENPAVGDAAFDTVLDVLDRLAPFISLEEVQPFSVFIYPSSADLGSAMRLAGQEWQPGQTYPELGVALVTVVNEATAEEELATGIGREVTDLLLYQAYGEAYKNIPQWLRSGLSGVAAGETDARSAALLADAVESGETISLAQLCEGFPTGEAEAVLAQAESGALVAAIADKYGADSINELAARFVGGDTCEAAFDAVLQSSPSAVEQSWLQGYKTADPRQSQISQAIIWVLLILGGFGVAALLVLRPKKAS